MLNFYFPILAWEEFLSVNVRYGFLSVAWLPRSPVAKRAYTKKKKKNKFADSAKGKIMSSHFHCTWNIFRKRFGCSHVQPKREMGIERREKQQLNQKMFLMQSTLLPLSFNEYTSISDGRGCRCSNAVGSEIGRWEGVAASNVEWNFVYDAELENAISISRSFLSRCRWCSPVVSVLWAGKGIHLVFTWKSHFHIQFFTSKYFTTFSNKTVIFVFVGGAERNLRLILIIFERSLGTDYCWCNYFTDCIHKKFQLHLHKTFFFHSNHPFFRKRDSRQMELHRTIKQNSTSCCITMQVQGKKCAHERFSRATVQETSGVVYELCHTRHSKI